MMTNFSTSKPIPLSRREWLAANQTFLCCYRNAWLFFVLLGLAFGAWATLKHAKDDEDYLTILLATSGGCFTIAFFYHQHLVSKAALLQSLFVSFNERYAHINQEITLTMGKRSLEAKDKQLLEDYVNLCAEEWLFYKLGYIPFIVWQSWEQGMNHYFSDPAIKEFLSQELQSGSYYGFNPRILTSVTLRNDAKLASCDALEK